jgi:hypothetical protein
LACMSTGLTVADSEPSVINASANLASRGARKRRYRLASALWYVRGEIHAGCNRKERP